MQTSRSSRAFLCGLLLLVSAGAHAQTLTERLDAIAGATVREIRSVGIAAAVARNNEQLLLQAYGQADVQAGTPLRSDTVLAIGSATKQFTAAAILQLRDAGKLSLDDDVTKWLPEMNTGGQKVTLRNLLWHTGGIIELVDIAELREKQLLRNPTLTRADVYQIVAREALRFAPGSMQTYTNTGYWLLGLIIEKASGTSYETYIQDKIFTPLGMTRSMYCRSAADMPGNAYGHGMRNGQSGRVPEIVHTATFAAGAICSTPQDLVTWLQALHGGKVLSPAAYAEMIAPATLNDGVALRYAMGLYVGTDGNGLKYIGHDGGGFGYSADTRWYPDARIAIVLLTNSEPDFITETADTLAATLMPPPPQAGPFPGDAAQLAGTYKGPGRGPEMVMAVTATPQGLTYSVNGGPPMPAAWIEGVSFGRAFVRLTFRGRELRFDTGGDHFVLQRQ